MGNQIFNLAGKTALITGGNGGIGLGFARGIAKQGGNICIWGRNEEKNKMALSELLSFGIEVEALTVDVNEEQSVQSAFRQTLEMFGRVDGCFANAGIGGRENFDKLAYQEWRKILDTNLDGLFFTLRAAARHMRERAEANDPGGRLIGTSSIGAIFGFAKHEAYAASKGAVISIMQALAVEYARFGVTANSVLPGHIETDMTTTNYQNEKFKNAILPRIAARRWGSPDDFEGIAAYLMSEASQYHTGDKFVIDGGFQMS